MKVRQLVAVLEELNPDADVRIRVKTADGFYDVSSKYESATAKGAHSDGPSRVTIEG